ncbi:MAG: AAA family ATPase [Bacteroidia bacterium]|nr:AAA family ATPase [Bacteroidia bacterium]MDW8302212.1 AAA family ATPase [Bacteroidia bacterium]
MAELLRAPAEIQFQEELEALKNEDKKNPKPTNWQLSPRAVLTYIMGGKVGKKVITPKYIGQKRLMEMAIATLATDRALLLYGLPGTAKSWVAEHLAAAISGDSSRIVQGTAGTPEESIRYGWNYAILLAKGPTMDAVVPSPIMRAMQIGAIARVEELTRIGADVQDSLLTILSEKALPIPELNTTIRAVEGFNIIATANNKDKGVNEMSSALKRRFNTVVLPVPASIKEEVEIVQRRLNTLTQKITMKQSHIEQIETIVTIFRELRNGLTQDGKTKLKVPSSTLSTAEAISVMYQGITMAYWFGNGEISPEDISSALIGAIIKDPVQDTVIFKEYMETVMKERENWKALYKACKAQI